MEKPTSKNHKEKSIKFAFATDDGINYSKEHFGSAKKYLIYRLEPESKKLIFEKEIHNSTGEEKIHGDPDKAKEVSALMKEMSVLVGFAMGPNIIRMRKRFVPVISRELNINKSLELMKNLVDKILEELKKEEGIDKEIIYLNNKE